MKFEKLENDIKNYCERHNIKIKKYYRNPFDLTIEIEGFECDWLEARITEKGRTVFKHNNKRASLKA